MKMNDSIAARTKTYELFKSLLERFCELASRERLDLTPYKNGGPHYFAALPSEVQVQTVTNFRPYVEVCEETVGHGELLNDDLSLLWRMFHRLGLHPVSDLMAHLSSGDIVEIHNSDLVQIFRNLRFFHFCSYTLDELLCRPFWELYRRDEKVTNEIISSIGSVFSGKSEPIVWLSSGPHTIDEIDSPERYQADVENRLLSPLYDSSGKVAAMVSTIRTISQTPVSFKQPVASRH